MNEVIKHIKIDLYNPKVYEVIKAEQGDDNSRCVEFELYNQGNPYEITSDTIANAEGLRADGSGYIKSCEINNNIITFVLDDNLLYYDGVAKLKLVLYSDNKKVLSSIPFKVSIERNPLFNIKFKKDEYSLINDVLNMVGEMDSKVSNVDNSITEHIEDNGKFKSDVYLNSPYKIKASVSSAYGTYTRNLIWYDQSSSVMYKSYSDEITDTIGIHIGDGSGSILIDAGSYIYLKGYRVSTSDGYAFSDEKIKMFTNDIKLDKEKIIKLFDLINIKTYTRRDEIDICSNVKIGISAQELENSMIQVGLDNAKYNIIDNHYNFMMNRGNDEEDAKYYPKFMTVNYDALYTLSLIKMRDMEEKHTLRLTELENRVTALENK